MMNEGVDNEGSDDTGVGKRGLSKGSDDIGVEKGGLSKGSEDTGVEKRGLSKQTSFTNLLPGMSERCDLINLSRMNVSRVNALRASINRHTDNIVQTLLTSKETKPNRAVIEASYRACRDAFMEVSTFLINLLEERSANAGVATQDIKKAVADALDDFGSRNLSGTPVEGSSTSELGGGMKSYASVAGSSGPEVHVSRGPTV